MTAHDTNLAEVRRLLPPGVSLIARDDDALILRARRGGARYVAVTLGVLAAILGAVAWTAGAAPLAIAAAVPVAYFLVATFIGVTDVVVDDLGLRLRTRPLPLLTDGRLFKETIAAVEVRSQLVVRRNAPARRPAISVQLRLARGNSVLALADVPTREQAFAVAGILAERLGLPAPRDPTAATTPG